MMKKLATVAILALVWISVAAIVSAATPNDEGTCIVPPDDYFVTDSLEYNGIPAHDEGIQLGFVFWTYDNGQNQYAGNHYLGITKYKLKDSHNDQEKIAMGKMFYCQTIPDHPYEPERWGAHVSENPYESEYLSAQEMRAQA